MIRECFVSSDVRKEGESWMFDKAKLYSSFTTVKRMYNVYLDRYLR